MEKMRDGQILEGRTHLKAGGSKKAGCKTLIKYFSKDTVGFYYSQIFDEPKEKNCE